MFSASPQAAKTASTSWTRLGSAVHASRIRSILARRSSGSFACPPPSCRSPDDERDVPPGRPPRTSKSRLRASTPSRSRAFHRVVSFVGVLRAEVELELDDEGRPQLPCGVHLEMTTYAKPQHPQGRPRRKRARRRTSDDSPPVCLVTLEQRDNLRAHTSWPRPESRAVTGASNRQRLLGRSCIHP